MLCSRTANNTSNKLHEQSHRLVYDDSKNSFSDLLLIDDSFAVIIQIFKPFLLEMSKIKHNLSESCNWNLLSQSDLEVAGTVFFGANSIR